MANLDSKSLVMNVGKMRVVKDAAFELAESKLDSAKSNFINEFDSHDITKEIEAGESSSNISGTLGGYGNLFSFIGFNSGSNPTQPIRDLIKKIRLIKSSYAKVKRDGSIFTFRVNLPKISEFENKTQMPWLAGRSWLLSIERGISGFGYFISQAMLGRSLGGAQSEKKIRSGSYKPVSYFSKMYSNFLKSINTR
jgi:hypothetical protein